MSEIRLDTTTGAIYNTPAKDAFPNEELGAKFETADFDREVKAAKSFLKNPDIEMTSESGAPAPVVPDAGSTSPSPAMTDSPGEPTAPDAPGAASSEEIDGYLDLATNQAQAQAEAEVAKEADVIPELTVPNQQAMKDSFNTEFTEEELTDEKVANLQNVGEPPEDGIIRNTDLLNAVDDANAAQAFNEEMKKYTQGEEGALTKTFRAIDYALAPLMAPIALTGGMMAHQPNTGTVVGDLLASIEAGGNAANERLFRWFAGEEGGMMPDYFGSVVENLLPSIPEAYRPTAAVALDLMITMPMSLGMATAMRTSLQSMQTLGRIPQHGMITEAVYQFLDWAPEAKVMSVSTKKIIDQIDGAGTDQEKVQQLIRDAELSEQGDRAAFVRLNEAMSGIKGFSEMTTDKTMESITNLLGDAESPTLNKHKVAKHEYDESGLLKDLTALADSNARKYNLNAMDDFGDYTRSIDEAFDNAKTKADIELNPMPDVPVVTKDSASPGIPSEFTAKNNARIIADTKLANKNIEELYGMDLQDMTATDATALMEVTVDSMGQLANYAAIFADPNVSRVTKDVAKAAFAKQLIAHYMIQAKVTGWGSLKGQELGIMRTSFMEDLIDSMKTRVC